ncbi:MAG: dihydroorotate dehydrogenase [Actinomycetia bacterium]|nr:dihydroorotate dehydrogenase [Actinomycetes bacterium]
MNPLNVTLGPVLLDTPLIGASGTLGSIVEFRRTVDLSRYGAVTAKSVAPEPWPGRVPPRMATTDAGMLNGIGIQNPGIDVWLEEVSEPFKDMAVPVWGSVVAHDPDGFAEVASKMPAAGVSGIEINLSCPNLDGRPFALDAAVTHDVVAAVRSATDLPIGAKLSGDAMPISAVAHAAMSAGADWLVIANTVMGAAIDVTTRRPALSGLIGGYSGTGIRPIIMRCVLEVSRDLPDAPIVACGGVSHRDHVIEFILAGADAVAIGTAHFARPRIAAKILKGVRRYLQDNDIESIRLLKGAYEPW